MTRYHYFINYTYCGCNTDSVIYISNDTLTHSRNFVDLCFDIDAFYSYERTPISINSISLLLTTDFEPSDKPDKSFTKHDNESVKYTTEVIYSGYHLKNSSKDFQQSDSKKLLFDISEYLAPILRVNSPEDLSKFFKLLLSKSGNKQIIYQNDIEGFRARNAIINYFEPDDGEEIKNNNESKEILIKNIIDSLVSLYEDFDSFSNGGELHVKYPNGMFIDSGIRMGIEMCFTTIRSLFYGYSKIQS